MSELDTRARASRPARARRSRGFSLVELLMVVVVTTLGFVALLNMQMATLRGLAHAKHVAEGTNLAENFIEQLRLEFMSWTAIPGQGLDGGGSFPHLKDLVVGGGVTPGAQATGDIVGAPGWMRAGSASGDGRRVSRVGPVNTLGFNNGIRQAMIQPGFEGTDRPYCMHYRLTWLVPDRAIRVEVEVSWPMANADMNRFMLCDRLASADLGQARSVTLTSSLGMNVFER